MFQKTVMVAVAGLICTGAWAANKRVDEASSGPVGGVNSPAGQAGAAAGNAGVLDTLAEKKARQPTPKPAPNKPSGKSATGK